MSQEQRPPTDSGDTWSQRWLPLIGGTVAGVLTAPPLALAGWLAFGRLAGADPLPVLGTLLWIASAATLGGGIAGPPGPARRARVVLGVVLAAGWSVVLWSIPGR